MGSGVFGVWVELKKTYKLSVIIISLLSILSTIGTAFSFTSGSTGLVTFCCFVVGFSMIPIMAVGFELGVEVTFPIDESYSTGLLMFAGQALGIVYVRAALLYTFLDCNQLNSYQRPGQKWLRHQLSYICSVFGSIFGTFFLYKGRFEEINLGVCKEVVSSEYEDVRN